MKDAKIIDRDTYLKVLGLFTLATNYYRIMREAEFKANEVLDLDMHSGTHISDAIYTDGGGCIRDFDEALRKQGIEIESALGAQ